MKENLFIKEGKMEICKVEINSFVDYLKENIWTYILFTPEISSNIEDIKNWEPVKGWCQLFYKNIKSNTRQIAINNENLSEGIVSRTIGEDDKACIDTIQNYIKDKYGISNCDSLIVDFSSVDHNILNALSTF